MDDVGAMLAAGLLAGFDAASGRLANPKGRWPGAAPSGRTIRRPPAGRADAAAGCIPRMKATSQ